MCVVKKTQNASIRVAEPHQSQHSGMGSANPDASAVLVSNPTCA